MTKRDPTESLHHVRSILMHQDYNNQTMRNDIALIQLVEPIQFTDYVMPVCIPPTRRRVVTVGDVCYSLGWGDTMGRYTECYR